MPSEKSFDTDIDTLIYNEIGNLDTMPDIAEIGLFDVNNFGIYFGNGEFLSMSKEFPMSVLEIRHPFSL